MALESSEEQKVDDRILVNLLSYKKIQTKLHEKFYSSHSDFKCNKHFWI